MQVAHLAHALVRRMERGVYTVPDKDVSQLRQILAAGAYEHMQVPVPACYVHMTDEALTQISTWAPGSVSQRRAAEDDAQPMTFLPHVQSQ